jgi:probable phosphoglycerate mutase
MRIHLPGELAGRFVLRHGQSVANVTGVIASSVANGGASFGLTPLGRDQVRRSVSDAQANGLLAKPIRVLASPLLRARESAQIVAEALDAHVRIDARLIERGFGSLELASDAQYERIWLADRADPSHRDSDVESLTSILDRVVELLWELDVTARDETVVLCTHGDVASVLLCAAAGRPLSQHRDVGAMGNGELRTVASLAAAARATASATPSGQAG